MFLIFALARYERYSYTLLRQDDELDNEHMGLLHHPVLHRQYLHFPIRRNHFHIFPETFLFRSSRMLKSVSSPLSQSCLVRMCGLFSKEYSPQICHRHSYAPPLENENEPLASYLLSLFDWVANTSYHKCGIDLFVWETIDVSFPSDLDFHYFKKYKITMSIQNFISAIHID